MDIDSVRTGRRTTSAQRIVSVATSTTALTGSAPNRVAILVSAPATNRFTLSLDTPALLDQGTTVYASGDPILLTVASHGDLVTRAWNAISATGTQNVTVVEVFLVA